MALAVPLSRFTSQVGGGSAFFVRRHSRMAFPMYTCSAEFAQRLPDLLARHDMTAKRIECSSGHDRYAIRAGFGRVQFSGRVEPQWKRYLFSLTARTNLFRWPFDMRLCRRVRSLLLAEGAEYFDLKDDHDA